MKLDDKGNLVNYTPWSMTKRNSPEAKIIAKRKDIRHSRHCVFMMHCHLVFVIKYRRNVFTPRVLDFLKASFESTLKDFESVLSEFEGEHDHVHLLIEYPPKVAISKLVNSLKGVSARMVRKKNFPEIRKKLWGNQLWSPSYFAGSCGGAPISVIKQYIDNQQRPI